ncbi:MAG: hypothetical protein KGL25_13505 [Gammaproteobacteria bacterium]|nr:hypothetical protein [Gammaproteobacteria bacterium]
MERRSDRLRARGPVGVLPALLALAAVTLHAAPLGGLSAADRMGAYLMLDGVRAAIEADYYDPSFGGHDLKALANAAGERIARAGTDTEAMAAIAQFELALDDRHTTFSPPGQRLSADYGWKMGLVGEHCYVIAIDPDSDAAHQGVAIGDQVITVEGITPARADLWRLEYHLNELQPLPALHVQLLSSSGQVRMLELAAKLRARRAAAATGEAPSLRIRPAAVRRMPDLLLLRMPSFPPTAAEMRGQLLDMHDRAALILDLRGNGGRADTALNELLGELYGDDFVMATRQSRGGSSPWTITGAGRNAYTGSVLVLVDAQSAAAAELFARTLQLTDRGTVIGDRTAGAVMEATLASLGSVRGERDLAGATSVSIAEIVMPDGGRLEKTGVTPDFIVLPSAADMAAGRDPALAQALALVGHPLDAAAAGRLYAAASR